MAEYIDKSAVISELIAVENRANRDEGSYKKSGKALYKDLCDAEIRIGKMLAADVAPVVHSRFVNMGGFPACERCGASPGTHEPKPDNPRGFPPYCYACGAKMDKEEA